MDADLSHHPKFIPTMIEYPYLYWDDRNKPAAISSLEAGTAQMAVWRGGVSWENWPAELPTSSQNSHWEWIAVISQAALDFTSGKNIKIQGVFGAADGQHKN